MQQRDRSSFGNIRHLFAIQKHPLAGLPVGGILMCSQEHSPQWTNRFKLRQHPFNLFLNLHGCSSHSGFTLCSMHAMVGICHRCVFSDHIDVGYRLYRYKREDVKISKNLRENGSSHLPQICTAFNWHEDKILCTSTTFIPEHNRKSGVTCSESIENDNRNTDEMLNTLFIIALLLPSLIYMRQRYKVAVSMECFRNRSARITGQLSLVSTNDLGTWTHGTNSTLFRNNAGIYQCETHIDRDYRPRGSARTHHRNFRRDQ